MSLYNSNIDFFIQRIFFGFGFITIVISIIVFFAKTKFTTYLNSFLQHAITTIKFAGIIGIIWFLIYIISYYSTNIDAFDGLFSTTNSGQLQFVIWATLLRFPILFGLSQLFWIKKVRTTIFYRNSVAILILLIAIFHGRFLENFIIFVTSFHRDYLPSSYSMIDDHLWKYSAYLIYKSSILFAIIVIIKWGISEIMNRLKNKNV